jgi:hypothetical protein
MEELTITIPDSWSEVTVDTWMHIDGQDQRNVVAYAATLWNLDPDVVNTMDLELEDLIDLMEFIDKEPAPELAMEIDGHNLITIESLSSGDLEDLEELTKDIRGNASSIVDWLYKGSVSSKASVSQLFGALTYFSLLTGELLFPDQLNAIFKQLGVFSNDPEKLTKMLEEMGEVDPEKVQAALDTISKITPEDGKNNNS